MTFTGDLGKIVYQQLRDHIGHGVSVVCYGTAGAAPVNVAVECRRCGVVIIDADAAAQDKWKNDIAMKVLPALNDQAEDAMKSRLLRDYTVLILASVDRGGYERTILFPSKWSLDEAEQKAVAVMKAAQDANPDEWGWDDYEPGFLKAGFVVPCWFHGPTWDACHASDPMEGRGATMPRARRPR